MTVAVEAGASTCNVRRIVSVGRNTWREAAAADSGVIVDAADYYRAFYLSAAAARRCILLSGWQFDSGVPLVRGSDAPPGAEVRFLEFLNGLCRANPALHVYILAWDFHVVLALEREWMQRLWFHWMTPPNLHFLFDDCPVSGGSHHQKFAVIDGTHAFLGGMDICESRWDDRRHGCQNPLRLARGKPQKPYHDVQAYLAGPDVTGALAELFWDRWECAEGERPAATTREDHDTTVAPTPRPRGLIPFGPARVALSRTQPPENDQREGVREVEKLFVDAVVAATELIYIETQYFSSRRIYEALVARMQASVTPKLDIVIVVNERAEALKEELAVGLRQAENLERLRKVAGATGHRLGLYFSLCDGDTEVRATYIHSKLMLIDDRFLTVGSANLTNRSMGVDSELHVAWEVRPSEDDVARVRRAIRRVRVSLLAEHGGLSGVRDVRALRNAHGLVARLDAIAVRSPARLKRHGPPSVGQTAAMEIVAPESLPFDPDTSPDSQRVELDEPADAPHGDGIGALLAGGVDAVRNHLPRVVATPLDYLGRLVSR